MHTLQLSDGGTIAYSDVGQGRPLVLLHGWAVHSGFFAPQQNGLSGDFRIIAPDLRGHGRSTPLKEGDGLQTLGADLAELVDRLDLADAVLVGWSMGAMVAWDFLLRYGGARIAGLVVIDMSPKIVCDEGWTLGLMEGHSREDARRAAAAMRHNWRTFCAKFVARIFAPDTSEERRPLLDWAAREARHSDAESMALLWLSLAEQDFRFQLGAISTPTLILFGQRSRLYAPQTAAWLEKAMPDAHRVAMAHSGHAPHLEEPERVNRLIGDFCKGLTPASNEAARELP